MLTKFKILIFILGTAVFIVQEFLKFRDFKVQQVNFTKPLIINI